MSLRQGTESTHVGKQETKMEQKGLGGGATENRKRNPSAYVWHDLQLRPALQGKAVFPTSFLLRNSVFYLL